MRSWMSITIAVAAMAASTAASAQQQADIEAIGRDFQTGSRAYALLDELTTTVGHRMTGTANGRAGEEFVYRKLKEYGFDDVRFQTFPITEWQRGSLRFTAGGKEIRAAALGYSPAHSDLSGDLVDIGNGTPADYAARPGAVKGKIALIYLGVLPGSPQDTPRLHRIQKTSLAIEQGASGVVFINSTPGDMLITGTANLVPEVRSGVPAIAIGYDSGMALKTQVAAGKREARIAMENVVRPSTTRNIIATIKGTTLPDEAIVLGGHLDSWDLATGAVDNGSGSMWVLDVARGLKARSYRPKRTIQFIFFMGEEEGLLGSRYFVDQAVKDGSIAKIKYMINTDMALDPISYAIWGGAPDMTFFGDLARKVQAVYPGFTGGAHNGFAGGVTHSDSQPFFEAGVPVAYPKGEWSKEALACVHTECDKLDLVSPDQMTHSAGIGAMLLVALADAETLPATPMSAEEVDAFFAKEGLKKGL
ncbi:M20/M25/M40 family metallo-hydrolase [Sphingopyxis fribergensis]